MIHKDMGFDTNMIAVFISSKHMSGILNQLGCILTEAINSPNIPGVRDLLEQAKRATGPSDHHNIARTICNAFKG